MFGSSRGSEIGEDAHRMTGTFGSGKRDTTMGSARALAGRAFSRAPNGTRVVA